MALRTTSYREREFLNCKLVPKKSKLWRNLGVGSLWLYCSFIHLIHSTHAGWVLRLWKGVRQTLYWGWHCTANYTTRWIVHSLVHRGWRYLVSNSFTLSWARAHVESSHGPSLTPWTHTASFLPRDFVPLSLFLFLFTPPHFPSHLSENVHALGMLFLISPLRPGHPAIIIAS